MKKEEILEMSRRENGRRDLAELETAAQAGNIAGRVGAGLCCLLSAVIVRTAGVMPVSPWVIFFGIFGTHYLVKFVRLKRKGDLTLTVLYLAMFVLCLVLLALRLAEVRG